MDYYNTAIKYLQDKYGKFIGYTSEFQKKLSSMKVKERKARIEAATYNDMKTVIPEGSFDKKSDDYHMFLLLKQYSYGQAPKDELKQLMDEKFGSLKDTL